MRVESSRKKPSAGPPSVQPGGGGSPEAVPVVPLELVPRDVPESGSPLVPDVPLLEAPGDELESSHATYSEEAMPIITIERSGARVGIEAAGR